MLSRNGRNTTSSIRSYHSLGFGLSCRIEVRIASAVLKTSVGLAILCQRSRLLSPSACCLVLALDDGISRLGKSRAALLPLQIGTELEHEAALAEGMLL